MKTHTKPPRPGGKIPGKVKREVAALLALLGTPAQSTPRIPKRREIWELQGGPVRQLHICHAELRRQVSRVLQEFGDRRNFSRHVIIRFVKLTFFFKDWLNEIRKMIQASYPAGKKRDQLFKVVSLAEKTVDRSLTFVNSIGGWRDLAAFCKAAEKAAAKR